MFSISVRFWNFSVNNLYRVINLKVYSQSKCNASSRICLQNRYFSVDTLEDKCYDLVIVGGGIVGLAVAQELISRQPSLNIALVEKEKMLATHQSGNNSGVIHAGVYYKPGSLRAKLCVEGLHRTYEYCDKHNIPYKKCGKLIVATNKTEESYLKTLYDRSIENKVPDVKLLSGCEIKMVEPYCQGLQAIHSPHTGIVDWAVVARKYGSEFQRMGGDIYLSFEVTSFDIAKEGLGHKKTTSDYPIVVRSDTKLIEKRSLRTAYVLTCCGLYSDKVAQMTGGDIEPKIIPFRGEYLKLKKEKEYLCRGNIYPVPDPRFPFLGVHYTPRMDGAIWLGPNAMLAFRKEGYSFWDIDAGELFETIKYPGFQKFISKHISNVLYELKKSFITSYQVRELQKFIPEIRSSDIERGPSGVRAQAMTLDGQLVEDFVFSGEGQILHCRNAPSPGATSSLAIGRELANRVEKQFELR